MHVAIRMVWFAGLLQQRPSQSLNKKVNEGLCNSREEADSMRIPQ
jgi:hypothetical protein